MTEVYIIGTGGAAKEIVQLIEQINAADASFEIKGFVDVHCIEKSILFFNKNYSLYEESDFLATKKKVAVIIAHGEAKMREKIFVKYANYNFPNLVHPSIDIHHSVKLGVGNIIKMGCLITTDIMIGNNNYINRGVQIGHDVNIENHNVLNPAVVVSGGVTLGRKNNIGASATLLQYKKIGSSNIIGAGAVLTQNVLDNKLLVGIPAKEKIN